MQWSIPQGDVDLSRWIKRLSVDDLDRFIADVQYLIEPAYPEDDPPADPAQIEVMATILGAARRWRDEQIDPIRTMRAAATENFYEDAA